MSRRLKYTLSESSFQEDFKKIGLVIVGTVNQKISGTINTEKNIQEIKYVFVSFLLIKQTFLKQHNISRLKQIQTKGLFSKNISVLCKISVSEHICQSLKM